ncbi:threonine synthase [Oceanobacillus jeddahense]|uniref:Threonine synthase n=1 Tax=Oceanobacillus jeddahense TaxID=1462527 RepID=A0ABY5JT69_9BACI|nr:threonine synthase [Oceanobacillus jeddahense]UUI02261.1 threonine synthase [Oceanobacillus jeddahense]
MTWSYATHYKCDDCKNIFPLNNTKMNLCPNCNGLMEVIYDLNKLKKQREQKDFKTRKRSIWRWHEFLPLKNESNIVSLGEGDTPLIKSNFIAKKLGLKNLYLKNETLMPTGSFKDRGFSLAISFAKELGISKGVTYSSGNAGMSFSTYANRTNMKSLTLIEYLANPLKKSLIKLYGGNGITLNYNSMNEITSLLEEINTKLNLYQFVNFINPIRHDAMKTYAYEISEELDWKNPDYMIHPVGTGGGLWGAWKGFNELYELGWIPSLPKMVAVQPSVTGPYVKAFKRGHNIVIKVGDSTKTIAQSISADAPIKDGKRILSALYNSNGIAEEVSENEIKVAIKDLGKEGIIADPASAATIAGLKRLVESSQISPEASIVCIITGTGLKQPKLLEELNGNSLKTINADINDFIKLLKEDLS